MIIPTSQIKKPKLRKVKQHVHGYTATHNGAGIQTRTVSFCGSYFYFQNYRLHVFPFVIGLGNPSLELSSLTLGIHPLKQLDR